MGVVSQYMANSQPQYWIFAEQILQCLKSTLTPKGLYVHGVAKLVLGSITWYLSIFRFWESFCEHVTCNKLRGSTTFIIF
jgi:hypothetical protein